MPTSGVNIWCYHLVLPSGAHAALEVVAAARPPRAAPFTPSAAARDPHCPSGVFGRRWQSGLPAASMARGIQATPPAHPPLSPRLSQVRRAVPLPGYVIAARDVAPVVSDRLRIAYP